MSKKLPKTITLAFLKKHFGEKDEVFNFWSKYFSINNTPLLEDFIKSCWLNMEYYTASRIVEKIIQLYLNKEMTKLYSILCERLDRKEWKQIDLSFIQWLRENRK